MYKVCLISASLSLRSMCDYKALLYPPAELTQFKLLLLKPSGDVWQVAAVCAHSALHRRRGELLQELTHLVLSPFWTTYTLIRSVERHLSGYIKHLNVICSHDLSTRSFRQQYCQTNLEWFVQINRLQLLQELIMMVVPAVCCKVLVYMSCLCSGTETNQAEVISCIWLFWVLLRTPNISVQWLWVIKAWVGIEHCGVFGFFYESFLIMWFFKPHNCWFIVRRGM